MHLFWFRLKANLLLENVNLRETLILGTFSLSSKNGERTTKMEVFNFSLSSKDGKRTTKMEIFDSIGAIFCRWKDKSSLSEIRMAVLRLTQIQSISLSNKPVRFLSNQKALLKLQEK